MKNVLMVLIVITAVTSVVTSGMANSNYVVSCEEISQIDTGGGAWDITISDNYAYVCDALDNSPGGLVIVDISDPTNPIQIGSYFDSGSPHEVTVRDNIAYVADFTDGLEILNVSDPSNPVEIGSYTIENMYTTSIKVFGDYAYVGDIHHGLFKLDINNLSDPVEVGRIPFYSCPSIDISSDFLITINHQEFYSGLEICDPIDLSRLGGYTPANTDFINPVLQQNLVIVVNHHQDTGEVQIINITDPRNPVLESKYMGDSIAQKCFVDGDLLYVSCSDAGIDIVDISNPAQPKKIGFYSDNSGSAFDLYVKDDIAYVADGDDGLEIIQMTFKETTTTTTSSSSTTTTTTTTTNQINGFSLLGCIIAIQLIKGIQKNQRNK